MSIKKKSIFSMMGILIDLIIIFFAVKLYLIDANKSIESIKTKGGISGDHGFIFSHIVLFIIFVYLFIWGPFKTSRKYDIYSARIAACISLILWVYFTIKLIIY